MFFAFARKSFSNSHLHSPLLISSHLTSSELSPSPAKKDRKSSGGFGLFRKAKKATAEEQQQHQQPAVSDAAGAAGAAGEEHAAAAAADDGKKKDKKDKKDKKEKKEKEGKAKASKKEAKHASAPSTPTGKNTGKAAAAAATTEETDVDAAAAEAAAAAVSAALAEQDKDSSSGSSSTHPSGSHSAPRATGRRSFLPFFRKSHDAGKSPLRASQDVTPTTLKSEARSPADSSVVVAAADSAASTDATGPLSPDAADAIIAAAAAASPHVVEPAVSPAVLRARSLYSVDSPRESARYSADSGDLTASVAAALAMAFEANGTADDSPARATGAALAAATPVSATAVAVASSKRLSELQDEGAPSPTASIDSERLTFVSSPLAAQQPTGAAALEVLPVPKPVVEKLLPGVDEDDSTV